MESSKSLTKRLSFAELEMFNKHDSQIAINNSELKDKTGNEILNILKVMNFFPSFISILGKIYFYLIIAFISPKHSKIKGGIRKVDFVHSNIAKGISDFEISYIPDFGYKDVLKFGEDFQNYPSGWKVMLDCIQKIPKYEILFKYITEMHNIKRRLSRKFSIDDYSFCYKSSNNNSNMSKDSMKRSILKK